MENSIFLNGNTKHPVLRIDISDIMAFLFCTESGEQTGELRESRITNSGKTESGSSLRQLGNREDAAAYKSVVGDKTCC